MNDRIKRRGGVSSNAMQGMHSNPPRPEVVIRFATRREIESAAKEGVPVKVTKEVRP